MSKISAVIPLYNGAKFIEQAIESILEQKRPADEIIVVDDGSTDNGASIVEAIASKNRKVVLLRKSNGGQGSARNFGVQHATGDLIALLDQDDTWYEQHLSVLEKPFLGNPDRRLAYTYANLDHIDRNGSMICHNFLNHIPKREHPKETLRGCLKEDMFVLPGASLILKTAFDKIGGFDERLTGYEDDDLFLRMFCAGFTSIFIDEAVTAWRIHPESTSYSMKMWTSRSIYFENQVDRFSDTTFNKGRIIRDVLAPRFAKHAYSELKTALRRNDKHAIDVALPLLRRYTQFLKRPAQYKIKFRVFKQFIFYRVRQFLSLFFKSKNEAKPIPRGLNSTDAT